MQYSIGEAAAKMHVSPHTLRYYDKEGLLPMVQRSSGGIRVFRDEDFGWLRLISCLKASGLPIKEIKQFIDWYMEGDSTLEKRRDLFYARRRAIQEQMVELQHTMDMINYKCWFYDTAVAAGSEQAVSCMAAEDLPEDIRRIRKSSGLYQEREDCCCAAGK